MTDNIYVGKVSKDGKRFVGEKVDVTSDFLKAVIERWANQQETIIEPDGKEWVISVHDKSKTPVPQWMMGK
jgi:hypothetical protein